MEKRMKIVLAGGGSIMWSPRFICDILLEPDLGKLEIIILDLDIRAGEKMVQFGQMAASEMKRDCIFKYTSDQKIAFSSADFVVITLSTGGLRAMEHDLKIPEDYDIYQTVGDTVGPGGWARGLRNIPVFSEMALNIEKYSNNAVVLNYTNPMTTLTDVFYRVSSLRTVGMCHGLFEVYDLMKSIFNLESWDDIKLNIGGINHFFWVTELSIKGEDGYRLLRKKMNGRPLAELVGEVYEDGAGFRSDKWVTSELFDTYGYLPYVGDRHICEFMPMYLTNEDRIKKYKIKRTTIEDRINNNVNKFKMKLDEYLSGSKALPIKKSREKVGDIISAITGRKEFISVLNLPNNGQIPNLPKGAVVETLGAVNSLGFIPLSSGELPQQIQNLTIPHVSNQMLITEAGLEGNMEKALFALYNDPLCSHLTLPEIKEMGMKLLNANKEYLPQFFSAERRAK